MGTELAGFMKLLGYGSGGSLIVVGSILAFQSLRIKSLKKTADRHDKILHGETQEGGLITSVQGTKKDVEYIKDDVTWIRNHLSNGGKK